MRLEFDAGVPRQEQLERVDKAKQPGRKHNRKPSSRIVEKRRAGAKKQRAIFDRKFREYKDKIAAYWRGELDTHP